VTVFWPDDSLPLELAVLVFSFQVRMECSSQLENQNSISLNIGPSIQLYRCRLLGYCGPESLAFWRRDVPSAANIGHGHFNCSLIMNLTPKSVPYDSQSPSCASSDVSLSIPNAARCVTSVRKARSSTVQRVRYGTVPRLRPLVPKCTMYHGTVPWYHSTIEWSESQTRG
jgi:hypothetical protein